MANKLISDLTAQAVTTDAFLLEVQDPTLSATRKATQAAVTLIEKTARIAQDDVIEAGVGLNADGTYDTPVGTTYLDATTDVMDALDTLDDAISASGSSIVVDIIPVSAANLNNAGIAPFQLIAAPGATKCIEMIAISIWLETNVTDVECGTQDLIIQYDTGASHFAEWANAWIEGSSDAIAKATWTSNVDMILNKKVELTFSTGANPTAGDSELKVWVTYIVRDTAFS